MATVPIAALLTLQPTKTSRSRNVLLPIVPVMLPALETNVCGDATFWKRFSKVLSKRTWFAIVLSHPEPGVRRRRRRVRRNGRVVGAHGPVPGRGPLDAVQVDRGLRRQGAGQVRAREDAGRREA